MRAPLPRTRPATHAAPPRVVAHRPELAEHATYDRERGIWHHEAYYPRHHIDDPGEDHDPPSPAAVAAGVILIGVGLLGFWSLFAAIVLAATGAIGGPS